MADLKATGSMCRKHFVPPELRQPGILNLLQFMFRCSVAKPYCTLFLSPILSLKKLLLFLNTSVVSNN